MAAILEATAQVLVTAGYERATTDAIAARAGVSIGTLYQYFPNKEALVAALMNRHVEEIVDTVRAALTAHGEAPLEVALRAMVRASVDAHRVDPALHKVLFEQVPRDELLGENADFANALQVMIERFLRARAPTAPRMRLRLIAMVLETSIESLTHRAIVEAPQWLKSGDLENEAVVLLLPYLEGALAGT